MNDKYQALVLLENVDKVVQTQVGAFKALRGVDLEQRALGSDLLSLCASNR